MNQHDDDFPLYDGPSKSQRKRDSAALQELGEELVNMSKSKLAAIPLDEDLREAIALAQSIKAHGGRKRQILYIGKLLRGIDPAPIKEAVAKLDQTDAVAVAHLHRLERWRERLLSEGNEALTQLMAEFPDADSQRLRQLIRNAQQEQTAGKPPKSARELFRYLRELAAAGSERP
ncbi:MAG TPA: ribosome biogenesis factor YjgA [Gammaproteobacteria bacterium]